MTTLRESLADLEHDRWSRWQRYLHSLCERTPDGALVIPAALVERWERQIATPYAALSERERDSDREEADNTLRILGEHMALPLADCCREAAHQFVEGGVREFHVAPHECEHARQLL